MLLPRNLRAHLAAFLCMALAAPATLAAVLTLNRYGSPPEQVSGPREIQFEVKPPPPPKPPKQERRRPQRRRQSPRRAPLPPPPDLGAQLSGVDLGLGDLQLSSLDAVSDQVLGDMDDVVHTESTVDTRPVPRETTPIEVPAVAKARNLSGHVLLNVLIGKEGQVLQVKVLEADPEGVFEDAVIQAVRNWTFEPATYRDRPVEVWATLPVEFQP